MRLGGNALKQAFTAVFSDTMHEVIVTVDINM